MPDKKTTPSKFTTRSCGPGLVKVTSRGETTPNSTPVKRAALGTLSVGNNEGDPVDITSLTRMKIESRKGTKASIVGASEGIREIRASADRRQAVSRGRTWSNSSTDRHSGRATAY